MFHVKIVRSPAGYFVLWISLIECGGLVTAAIEFARADGQVCLSSCLPLLASHIAG